MLSCRHRFRAGFLTGRSWAPSPAGIMQLAWCWTNLMRLRYRRDGSIWVKAPFVRELPIRSEEHTSELQSLMRISYAVFSLKKNTLIHSQPLLPLVIITLAPHIITPQPHTSLTPNHTPPNI